jgi:hypothetical protein
MISNELQQQAERYTRSRSFALQGNLKDELATWYKINKNLVLNKNCGTCLRNAMRDLCSWLQSEKNQEVKPAKIQFIGVKEYNFDTMSYNDLKALAQNRGLAMGRAPKKTELIEALKS